MLNCWLMARGIVPANSAGTVSASQRTQERTPVKNALDSLSAGRKTELFGWLTEEGRFAPDIGRLLEVLCEKLTALGVPIARATAHVRTLHPEFRALFNTSSKPDSGLILSLAKPPTGTSRSSQRCGRKASRIM